MIDRDGVLMTTSHGQPIGNAVGWFNNLVATGTPCLVATNHTTSSPDDAAAYLQSVGFNLSPETMHTPLTILFDYLQIKPPGNVLLMGTPELHTYLSTCEITLIDPRDHITAVNTVILGFKRDMDRADLTRIIDAVHHHGAQCIALHENRLYKNSDGQMEPGLGTWVRAVEYATNTRALIVGKPNEYYYQAAMKRLGTTTDETVMISDDPFSDLSGAKRAGLKTVFITTGKYPDVAVLNQISPELQPDEVWDALPGSP